MGETGQIDYENADTEANQAAYKKWHKASIKATGKLSLPGTEAVEKKQPVKVSRIDKALASMPPVKNSPLRKQPIQREISPHVSVYEPSLKTQDDDSCWDPLHHGSIPDWDSDYEYKMVRIMRNIEGDNFKPKVLRPKKNAKRRQNDTPYSEISDSDRSDYNDS